MHVINAILTEQIYKYLFRLNSKVVLDCTYFATIRGKNNLKYIQDNRRLNENTEIVVDRFISPVGSTSLKNLFLISIPK